MTSYTVGQNFLFRQIYSGFLLWALSQTREYCTLKSRTKITPLHLSPPSGRPVFVCGCGSSHPSSLRDRNRPEMLLCDLPYGLHFCQNLLSQNIRLLCDPWKEKPANNLFGTLVRFDSYVTAFVGHHKLIAWVLILFKWHLLCEKHFGWKEVVIIVC